MKAIELGPALISSALLIRAGSAQVAFYALVPFYGLAVLSFLCLARALGQDAHRWSD